MGGIGLNHFAVAGNVVPGFNKDKIAGAQLTAGRITEIKFQAKGCVPAIACGSALTEL